MRLKAVVKQNGHMRNNSKQKIEMKLVIQDELSNAQVFHLERTVAGRLQSEYKFLVEGGPRYTIEPSVQTDAFFLRKSKNQQLIGLLTNGALDKSTQEVEKLFYLSKLDLVRNDKKTN